MRFTVKRGQLPGNEGEAVNPTQQQGKGPKQDGILAKLGRNLTEEAREGKLDTCYRT